MLFVPVVNVVNSQLKFCYHYPILIIITLVLLFIILTLLRVSVVPTGILSDYMC